MISLYFLHPLFAFVGVSLCAIVAFSLSRALPFYKRELKVEDATRLTPLDGLRGILCFSVMYHHAVITRIYLDTGSWQLPPSPFYALLGQTSVAFFFCVTGFLFWSRVLTVEGQIKALPFLRARALRIIPLYSFSCVLALALAARHIDWTSLATARGLARMGLMGLLQWPSFGSLQFTLVNAAVVWSLQYEWVFYLFIPILALLIRSNRALYIIPIILTALLLLRSGPHVYFLSGMIAAYAARRPQVVRVLQLRSISAGVVIVLVLLPLVTGVGYGYKAIVLTTLAFVPLACGNSLFGLLNMTGLRLMGMISYSVYLLHGIILYAARPLLSPVRNGLPLQATTFWLYTFALSLGVLTISLLTYRWIEWPFIQMEKRLRRASKPAQNGAVESVAP